MKHHKEFIKKITEIENEFDVNSLICNGVNIWPLIRLELINVIINASNPIAPKIESIVGLYNKSDLNNAQFNKFLNSIKINKIDILLYSEEYLDSSLSISIGDGVYYDKFIDSFYTLFNGDFDLQIIKSASLSKKYINSDIKLDINIMHEQIRIDSLVSYYNSEYNVENLNAFVEYLFKNEIILDINYIKFKVSCLMSTEKFFKKLLLKIPVKLIVFARYYTCFNMGMLLASMKLGIRSLDLQHGVQNDYHYMYSHWNKIPKKGYELLPKYFWMWNDISYKRIEKWTKLTSYHYVFVVGNLFLLICKDIFKSDLLEIEKYYPKEKVNILISLQTEIYYSDEITKAINSCNDNNIIWHFKGHPSFEKNLFNDKIKNKLISLDRVESDFTNNTSLYELIDFVDINITYSSSTALELQELVSVPSIFVRRKLENDLDGFYCTVVDDILNAIKYIKNNRQKIKNAIRKQSYVKVKNSVTLEMLKFLIKGGT